MIAYFLENFKMSKKLEKLLNFKINYINNDHTKAQITKAILAILITWYEKTMSEATGASIANMCNFGSDIIKWGSYKRTIFIFDKDHSLDINIQRVYDRETDKDGNNVTHAILPFFLVPYIRQFQESFFILTRDTYNDFLNTVPGCNESNILSYASKYIKGYDYQDNYLIRLYFEWKNRLAELTNPIELFEVIRHSSRKFNMCFLQKCKHKISRNGKLFEVDYIAV